MITLYDHYVRRTTRYSTDHSQTLYRTKLGDCNLFISYGPVGLRVVVVVVDNRVERSADIWSRYRTIIWFHITISVLRHPRSTQDESARRRPNADLCSSRATDWREGQSEKRPGGCTRRKRRRSPVKTPTELKSCAQTRRAARTRERRRETEIQERWRDSSETSAGVGEDRLGVRRVTWTREYAAGRASRLAVRTRAPIRYNI